MIFYIFVFVFVVALVVYKLDKKGRFCKASNIFMRIGAIGSLISLYFIIMLHIFEICTYENKVEQYNKIMYQIDSGQYQYNILDEIEEWNIEIKLVKKYKDNIWVGIFYSNIYDEFEPIDYSSYQPN